MAEAVVTLAPIIVTGARISDLRSNLGSVVRPNNFSVSLSLSLAVRTALGLSVGASDTEISTTFPLRCEKAELPGRTIATSDDTSIGTSLKLPYDMTYNDIQLSIICASDMKERRFFEAWMRSIVKRNGTIAYYSDYAKGNTLTVSQLDDDGTSKLTYQCRDIYPIAITPMNATWEENNTYQRFGVTLCYRFYDGISVASTLRF